MRLLLVLLCAAPAALAAQVPAQPPAAASDAPVQVLVRRAEGVGQTTLRIETSGRLLKGIGVAPGNDGTVELVGGTGSATAPVTVELSAEPGSVTFSVPSSGPALELVVAGSGMRARGNLVRVARDSATRQLRVEAGILTTR